MDTAIPNTLRSAASTLVPPAGTRLTTGWEDEVAPGDTILRNYVATLSDRLTGLAGPGGRIERTDLALYVDLDSAYVFDNIVIPHGHLGPDGMSSVVEHAKRFFPASRSFAVQALSPTLDLAPHGLHLLGHPPLMFRPAGGVPTPPPDGLEIRRVESADELGDFERTLAAAYPLPEGSAVLAPGALGRGFRGWIGYVDGFPAATAGAHTAHGLTEIEWVATLPRFRGRGVGAALTWAATVNEPDTSAVLVATDDGRPVYERLGYVPLMRLAMWLRAAQDT